MSREAGGIAFASLRENTPAFRDGFRPGDLILAVNGQPVRGLGDFARALGRTEPGKPVVFDIVRNQSRQVLTLTGPVAAPRL
ncbi:MAG: PDZ domain-containing protein [Verrucomicrobia bacterium]|nr:PDZ domain-containing protein [Verrucomicrobiota bacterium]